MHGGSSSILQHHVFFLLDKAQLFFPKVCSLLFIFCSMTMLYLNNIVFESRDTKGLLCLNSKLNNLNILVFIMLRKCVKAISFMRVDCNYEYLLITD